MRYGMNYLFVTDKWNERLVYVPKPATQNHAWRVCMFIAAQCNMGTVLSVSKFL